MTAALPPEITGRKGGESKPKEPTEAADSLRSIAKAKMLIAVGEGEFDGAPTSQTIFLDNTPLADAQGNSNFAGVTWEWRPGTVEQPYIPGLPSVENETTINVELRSTAAWVRSISNTQLSAVRLRFAWPALQQQDSEGNINGYRIEYAVDVATDGGAYQQVLLEAVDGKTTTRYERSRRIDLPKSTSGWQIRVRRITANQNNNRIADTMSIAGITEVIDAKLRYPNTALLYLEFSAEQFSNIPAVTVRCKARKVQIPSTYDPVNRTYSGVWDGSFKSAWTNNPAWITFDVATNDRFGLGKRIKPWMVDKYELYRIAQYCDQLVPDGKGGQEPRYLCDLNLQSRTGAWELLRDISAIYRGMTYWAQGQLNVQADIPRSADFDFAFTRANVVDGKFTYGSASERTRYTRALVSYDNPANNYDTDVAAASDSKLQRRYGDNPVEISAIGCTRESEAQRRGKWILLTNSQDRTVTFRVGMDGRIPLPGHVIPLADKLIAGDEIGGRISAATGTVITLDRDTRAKVGDRLIINLPSGACEGRTIRQVAGRQIAVTTAYSETPQAELVWTLDADDLAVPLYRVMKVTRPEEGVFEISALQFEPSKFAAIDTGAKLESRPISILPTGTVEAPASVALSAYHAVNQGITVTTMTISWTAVAGAVAYDVEWRKDSGNWVRIQRTGSLAVDIPGIYAGAYLARVRAVNAVDIASVWKASDLTQLTGKVGAPPALAQLKTTPGPWKITLDWSFPAEGAADSAYTEIQQASTAQGDNAQSMGLFAYPTNTYTLTGLAAGARLFFRGRLIDRIGNVGPWTDWTVGTASADATEYNQLITEQFVKSALSEQLFKRIDLIDADATVTNSVAYRVAQEAKARADADTAEATARVNADKINADAITTEANARAAAVLQEAKDRQAAVTSEATTRQSADTSLGQRIDTVSAANGSNASAIQTEVKARTDADTALGSRIDTVAATTNGNTSAISNEVKARTDADSALGTRIDSLSTTVGNNTTAITSETKARTDADTALGQRVDTVSSSVAGKADSTTVQTLQNQVTAQGTTITSQGSAITSINANLANAGGENLLYNPAFTEVSSNAALAKGWNMDGGTVDSTTSATASLVTSWLSAAEKSMRIDFKGIDTSARYFSIVTASAYRAKATAGQVLTASIYVRATAGIRMQIFIQALKADGTAIGAPVSALFELDTTGKRISFTHPGLPTDTALVSVFYRIRSSASGVADGYVEGTRAQLEVGAIVTGWKNNGQVAADGIAANATATAAVTARVTSAEGAITNQGSAITSLQNGLSTTNGNVTAAQNSVNALQNTVTSQGNSITAQGNQITTINSNLATVGGENLLFNPSFDTWAATTQSWADGWEGGADGAVTWSRATSSLDPAGFSQKAALTGLAGDKGAYVTNTFARASLAAAGQTVTLSAFVKATAGVPLYLALRGADANQASLGYLEGTRVAATGDWQRLTLTFTLPAGTVYTRAIVRVLGTSGISTVAWEIDRAQLEIGAQASGWHDNGKVVAAGAAANATATTALGSRVTTAEGTITSQGSQITNLQAQIAGTGMFAAGVNFEFLSSLRGAYLEQAASGATLTAYQQNATLTGYANFRLPTFANTNGAQNYLIKMRIRRRNTTRNPGRIYWANEDGALSEARTATFSINLNTTDWQDIEIDLSSNTAWSTKTSNSTIRFDFLNSQDTSAVVDIAYIAIGRRSAAASATALSDTQATVTQQGTTLTSQAASINQLSTRVGSAESAIQSEQSARSSADEALGKRVDTTQASLGNTNASVQQISQAQANTDGKVNANWAVKLGVTQDGTYYMAGIGVGIEPGGGNVGLQSSVAVAADRFLVLGPGIDGKGKAFFSVVNNQTFIDTAFINKLYVSQALVGQSIVSQTLTSYGAPRMTADFNEGQIVIQNANTNGRYMIIRQDGIFLVADGVVLVEMSLN
jgi:predicted phage tail protein